MQSEIWAWLNLQNVGLMVQSSLWGPALLIGIGPGGGGGVVGGVAKRAHVFSEMQNEVVMLWLRKHHKQLLS